MPERVSERRGVVAFWLQKRTIPLHLKEYCMNKWMKWFWPLAVGMTLVLSGCGGGSSSSSDSNDGTNGDDQNPPVEEVLSVSVLPADGSIGVEVNTIIVATFNKEMNSATLNDAAVYLTVDGATHVTAERSYANKVLTFAPAVDLDANATYQFVITTDVATTEGEHLASTQTTTFTTGDMALSAPSAVVASMAPTAVTVDSDESEVLAPATGALLGTSLEVNAAGWQGLADTDIPLSALIERVNGQLNADTLEALLADSMPLEDFLGVISAQLGVQNALDAQALVEQLLTQVSGGALAGLPVQLGDLVQLPAGLSGLSVEEVTALLNIQASRVTTLSLLSALNGAVNPTLATPVEIPLSMPPLLESSVKVQTVTPPAVAVLEVGGSVHSSATRAHMDLNVGGEDISELTGVLSGITATITDSSLVNDLLGLTGGLLNLLGLGDALDLGEHLDPAAQTLKLPIYMELGSSEAEVAALDAENITMNVTTGLTRLYLGTIDENIFFSQEALSADDFEPAEVLNVLGLISVTAKGYAVAESDMQEMHFLPIAETQTQRSLNPAGTNVDSLLATLLANLELTVNVAGIEIGTADATAVQDAILGLFSGMMSPIAGSLLDTMSELLGAYVGSAEISVLGVVAESE
jgi:hypothetical protein